MQAGESYLNIHTSVVPGGEIRGFLSAATGPEPGSFALVATVGLCGAAVVARRRRA